MDIQTTGFHPFENPHTNQILTSEDRAIKEWVINLRWKELERIKKQRKRYIPKRKEAVAILMETQEGVCNYCNKPLGDDFEIDHIRPVAKNGETEIDNLQLLHQRCNRKKSKKYDYKRTYDERTKQWY